MNSIQFDFKEQTAIVTGGTRGIGRAVSEAFLKAGARVIATYHSNKEAAERFRAGHPDHSGRLDIHGFDVADYSAAEDFFRRIEASHGQFQILVNSSGIRLDAIVGMMKEADWRAVIDTNLTGTFNMSKHAVKHFLRQRYGRIITITSPVGRIGFPGQANYAASKAGQVAFTRSLAKEVASRKITVNCVSPGFIDTDFIGGLPGEQKKHYLGMVPLKRFGAPEEVARSVLYLAARESAYITGAVLEVAGGL